MVVGKQNTVNLSRDLTNFDFVDLTNLEKTNYADNQIAFISPKTFAGLSNLKKITL